MKIMLVFVYGCCNWYLEICLFTFNTYQGCHIQSLRVVGNNYFSQFSRNWLRNCSAISGAGKKGFGASLIFFHSATAPFRHFSKTNVYTFTLQYGVMNDLWHPCMFVFICTKICWLFSCFLFYLNVINCYLHSYLYQRHFTVVFDLF